MPNKVIVILGPTASGKSSLAIKLAKKINGEVISADSRQVYKGMDIGTGKITKKEMQGIPHHLLNVASPKRRFTVTQYRKLAIEAIYKIFKNHKVPIICGGTGFYIQAVIDGLVIPEVKPDLRLRKKLEKLKTEELFKELKKLDPRRAGNIDQYNRRRLIRALEIIIKTEKPVPTSKKNPLPYPVLIIGIKKSQEELKGLIQKHLLKRLKMGTIAEIKKLRKSGLSWKKLDDFGLEYRWLARYLQMKDVRHPSSLRGYRTSKISTFDKSDFFNKLQKDIEHFAKRQITWFKRDKRIHWVKNNKEAEKLAGEFLKKE